MNPPVTLTAEVPRLDVGDISLNSLTQEDAFLACFPVGSVFPNKSTLSKSVKLLSAKYHFTTSGSQKTEISCACAGYTRSNGGAKRKRLPSHKCGCSWVIKFKGPLINRLLSHIHTSSTHVSLQCKNICPSPVVTGLIETYEY